MEMRMDMSKPKKSNLKLIVIASLVVVMLIGLAAWGLTNLPISAGDRAGYLQKFSHKRHLRTLFLVPTWEGDLALFGSARTSGAVGNVWHFTVDDSKVATALNDADLSRPVKLHYKQYFWSYFGDTEYRITNIKPLGEQ